MTDSGKEKQASYIGIGIALGVAIGAAFGVALGNLAFGIGIGIALGGAFGLALYSRQSRKSGTAENDGDSSQRSQKVSWFWLGLGLVLLAALFIIWLAIIIIHGAAKQGRLTRMQILLRSICTGYLQRYVAGFSFYSMLGVRCWTLDVHLL